MVDVVVEPDRRRAAVHRNLTHPPTLAGQPRRTTRGRALFADSAARTALRRFSRTSGANPPVRAPEPRKNWAWAGLASAGERAPGRGRSRRAGSPVDRAQLPWREAVRAVVVDPERRVLLVHFDFVDDDIQTASGPAPAAEKTPARPMRRRSAANFERRSASRSTTSVHRSGTRTTPGPRDCSAASMTCSTWFEPIPSRRPARSTRPR